MGRFDKITDLIPMIEAEGECGEWVSSDRWPVESTPASNELLKKAHECLDENEDLGIADYRSVLESYGLFNGEDLVAADVQNCDARCLFSMIFAIVREERFWDGILVEYFKSGKMLEWLKRLRELDEGV
ncbi:MAG: DUF6508 domain-containing protein [Coriobacteriia bacterium]|nr:DUF6508 domain-containing protein [Coriobacteriia bacterium]